MSGDGTNPGTKDGPKHPPAPPRTGEGSGTALEALIRKRKQVESPDPPDAAAQQPASP